MNRTENLMLYICDKLKNEETFGSIVFNKVLYYIDNISYLDTGVKISDFDYIKQGNGPTPEPSHFLGVRGNLEMKGKLKIEHRPYWGKIKKVPVNRVEPDMSKFSELEMSTIDSVIDMLREANGSQVSDISHKEMSWQVSKNYEKLPLFTFLLSHELVTNSDVEWANKVLNVHN